MPAWHKETHRVLTEQLTLNNERILDDFSETKGYWMILVIYGTTIDHTLLGLANQVTKLVTVR